LWYFGCCIVVVVVLVVVVLVVVVLTYCIDGMVIVADSCWLLSR
jgi:hypothetical protein